MNAKFSVWLDLVRFLAALSVAFYHFSYERFTDGFLSPVENSALGHNAVVVFFVLSGFVIFHSVLNRDMSFSDYFSKRITRLYSVLIPALFIVLLVDKFGELLYSDIYDGKSESNYFFLRFIINATFLQEIHNFSFRYLSNGPLWSLGYEFWYYVIFGFIFFVKNSLFRFALIVSSVLFVGLKIIILFPVWLLGLVAYKACLGRSQIYIKFKCFGFFITLLIFTGLTLSNFGVSMKFESVSIGKSLFGDVDLGYSRYFFYDYLLGLIFSLFLFFSSFFVERGFVSRIFSNEYFVKVIRNVSGSTLTLYVLHFPILLFIYAVFNFFRVDTGICLDFFIFGLTVLICYLISFVFENKKSFSYKRMEFVISNTLKLMEKNCARFFFRRGIS
jgi:peptidoglycan/LPS O-acetylase OafA/YrhL